MPVIKNRIPSVWLSTTAGGKAVWRHVQWQANGRGRVVCHNDMSGKAANAHQLPKHDLWTFACFPKVGTGLSTKTRTKATIRGVFFETRWDGDAHWFSCHPAPPEHHAQSQSTLQRFVARLEKVCRQSRFQRNENYAEFEILLPCESKTPTVKIVIFEPRV